MMRKLSFAALAVLGCMSASAAADNRIRSLDYDPDQIVRILGKAGIQSTIEFAADERIENVAVGDSSAWQITPNRRASLLFVKPLSAHSRTNMTVVTDRRTYMFDLVAGDRSTTPVYALKFSYPNEKPVVVESKPTPQQEQALAATASQPQATLTAEKLHFDWQSKGYAKLMPARVFDDGDALYMAWNRETPLPAILTMSEDRKEGPVNYRMSGDYVVVTPVPQNLVLRYGSRTAALWPTRRISATAPKPVSAQPPAQIAQSKPATPPSPPAAVKLANVAALYNDNLTDSRQ